MAPIIGILPAHYIILASFDANDVLMTIRLGSAIYFTHPV